MSEVMAALPDIAALKSVPAQSDVTPRDIHFMEPGAHPKAWLGGDAVATAVFNALSLTFPDGERLFMDSVRNYKSALSGMLLADANAFITQEAIHTREHVAMNKLIDREHYPVARIEEMIRARTAIPRGLGPMTMLAVTTALEHFTAMLGDALLKDPSFLAGAPEDIRRLWQWHAMEETEHKAVAFDVFLEATRGWSGWRRYTLRARTMILTTVMFNFNILTYTAKLLEADGMGPLAARWRVIWYLFGKPGLFRKSWSDYWRWYRPGFHPWDLDNRATLDAWKRVFSPEPLAGAA